MKAFRKKTQQATPLRQDDNENAEAGQFIPETQNTYANLDVGEGAAKSGGGQLDEYRG